MSEIIDYLKNDNINVSVVSAACNRPVYTELYEKTGGIFANVSGNFKDELLSIADMISDETNNGYWIALNGLIPQVVRLDEKPVINGTCDTDGDTLPDWKELDNLKAAKSIDITPFLNHLGFKIKTIDKRIPIYNYTSNPVKVDSDNDGLLDGKPICSDSGEIIAPVDSQPLVRNGTKKIWESHIENKSKNSIPNAYCNSSNFVDEIAEYIPDDAKKTLSKYEKELADELVKIILKLRNPANKYEKELRKATLFIKKKCEGDTVLGAYILNFVYDNEYMAYHSQPDTWQRDFGYNDFYDDVFRIGSYMDFGRLLANCAGEEYALWMWKGDYWNLQTGSEIGLYVHEANYSGTKQYDVVDFEVPMKLYLYNCCDKETFTNVFSWEPEVPQWWITGFNPKYKDPDPNEMVTIGMIDFSDEEYAQLYTAYANSSEENYHNINTNNIVFDNENCCIWVIWYNEEYVR